jgi:hypothetical protein
VKRSFAFLLIIAFVTSATGCKTLPEYAYDGSPPEKSQAGTKADTERAKTDEIDKGKKKEPKPKMTGFKIAAGVALLSVLFVALFHNEPDGPRY